MCPLVRGLETVSERWVLNFLFLLRFSFSLREQNSQARRKRLWETAWSTPSLSWPPQIQSPGDCHGDGVICLLAAGRDYFSQSTKNCSILISAKRRFRAEPPACFFRLLCCRWRVSQAFHPDSAFFTLFKHKLSRIGVGWLFWRRRFHHVREPLIVIYKQQLVLISGRLTHREVELLVCHMTQIRVKKARPGTACQR